MRREQAVLHLMKVEDDIDPEAIIRMFEDITGRLATAEEVQEVLAACDEDDWEPRREGPPSRATGA